MYMVDALTQNHYIPPAHLWRVMQYSLCYVVAMLALAIVLFQKREVG